MADLVLRTSQRVVDLSVKNQLLLAYGTRITNNGGSFPDVATLRTVADKSIHDDELAYVSGKGFTYQFGRFSTANDDGDLVIKPTDGGTSGRWLKTSSTVATGYAKTVRIHLGEDSYKSMLRRGLALRPSIHILFDGMTPYSRSLSKGALYQCAAKYKIRVIPSSVRSQQQQVEGSDVATETDPGTHQMMADVIASLAGSALGTTGVTYTEIGQQKYLELAEEGRLTVEEIEVTVFYTVHQPDVGSATIDALSGITVQRKILGGGSAYDASNLITSGYTIPTGAGFTKTPSSGVAVINGQAVSSSPAATTFAANSDTYRDLHSDGTFSYTAVANGRSAPSLVYTGAKVNTIRAGVTVTDANGVIYDAMLASTLVNWQGVDYVPAAGVSVSSIAITPTSASFTTGQTQKFTATATYTDGRTADISTVVTWVSSNTAVATIAYDGTATWAGVGVSTISCSYDGLAGSNTATLTGN